jgi:hypothetical protein
MESIENVESEHVCITESIRRNILSTYKVNFRGQKVAFLVDLRYNCVEAWVPVTRFDSVSTQSC